MFRMKMGTITEELIESYRTKKGGWTKHVLAAFGVSWPSQHGWKQTVLGKPIDLDALPPKPEEEQDLFSK
jgi:hypothetical protein